MNLAKFIFLAPIFIACIKGADTKLPLHSNRYYSIYSGYDEKTYEVDSVIVEDVKGKRNAYPLNQNGVGDYPYLYKDRLVSLIYGRERTNLISVHLRTQKVDTLCSEIDFLETSSMDEYDGMIVIRDTDKYGIVDVEKKKLVKESSCFLENILLTDSTYFLVRLLNDTSEPKPFLCKGNVSGPANDIRLIQLPGMGVQQYEDATTCGWNGMAVQNGILFIHLMNEIVAYDVKANKIVASIGESREVHYRISSKKPVFLFENEKITFDMKNKQFVRS